jgi:YVTN family beta-propeller protein
VIGGASNNVIATVPVGGMPLAICYNPANDEVYCVNSGDNTVTVIGGGSNGVITTVTVGYAPTALACDSADNKVYCANTGDTTVTVINGANNGVIATIATMFEPGALCHDRMNNKLYCAHSSYGLVTVIDCASDQVIKTIHLSGESPEPCAFTWNPLQNRVYVADKEQGMVAVLRDSMSGGIEETMSDGRGTLNPGPTVVRGVLFLESRGEMREARGELLDISGRKVLGLKPGANDVGQVAPGVYFVCRPLATARVVIAR